MPKRVRERLQKALAVYLLFAWGVSWAALVHAAPDLLGLPWAQAGVGCLVSWLGGFAATLGRRLAAQYDGKTFHAKHEFIRDGAVSVVVGVAGYMAGVATRADEATLSLVLLLGGYAGTRTLALWVDRVIKQKEPA